MLKFSLNTFLILLADGLITAGFWLCLWFILKKPDKWAALVDRENAFWVRTGIMPAALNEKIKRFEKGRGMKMLVVGAAVFGSVAFILEFICFLVVVIYIRSRR